MQLLRLQHLHCMVPPTHILPTHLHQIPPTFFRWTRQQLGMCLLSGGHKQRASSHARRAPFTCRPQHIHVQRPKQARRPPTQPSICHHSCTPEPCEAPPPHLRIPARTCVANQTCGALGRPPLRPPCRCRGRRCGCTPAGNNGVHSTARCSSGAVQGLRPVLPLHV